MKKAKIFITTALLAATISSNAYAGSWQQNETGYWWQNDDGSYPVNTWQWQMGITMVFLKATTLMKMVTV